MNFRSTSNRSVQSDGSKGRRKSGGSTELGQNHMQAEYNRLLQTQLCRLRSFLGSNFAIHENHSFVYHDCHVSFDVSNPFHTFMVSSTAYTAERADDMEKIGLTYMQLERDLGADVRLEWNEDDEIIIYQNLPICLVQEECCGEFETIMEGYLQDFHLVNAQMRSVSHRALVFKNKPKQKGGRKLLRIFNGRAA